jgi:hypothetical protein
MKTFPRFPLLVAGVLIPLVSNSHGALITGLVNYWNFDGNLLDSAQGRSGAASTVADNGIFAGSAGTAGISFGTGLFGSNSIELDGAAGVKQNNGFVRVTRSADTLFGANVTGSAPNTVTISMWVTVAGNDQDWQTMISHGEGNQYRIARRAASVTNAAYAGGSGDIPGSDTGPNLSGGGWHHILAISENAISTRIWVDGGLVATGAAPVINDAQGGGLLDLNIGANPDTGAQNREWWGRIDDVAQWNRVLTPAEIAQVYGGGPATAQSLGALIPEPASGILSVLGFAAILRRRRR